MPIYRSARPRIAITLGDPAGIGPEVAVRALHRLHRKAKARFLVLGPSALYNDLSTKLNLSIRFRDVDSPFDAASHSGGVVPCYFPYSAVSVRLRGKAQSVLTRMAVQSIDLSAKLALSGRCDAVVTAPINKAGLKKAGYAIPGHTEYLAKLSGSKNVEMMLAGGPLRVVLVTRHIPLQKVSAFLSIKRIVNTIRITDQALRRSFGISRPKIVVAGLNPHAGEEGTIGKEEVEKIAPAVRLARKTTRSAIVGPLSPDALFYDAYEGRYDAVICMYHDQGLIPLKMISRGHGVNITLGLPFIRTSPDHGTAYDIALKFTADSGSMEEAIHTALQIAQRNPYARA